MTTESKAGSAPRGEFLGDPSARGDSSQNMSPARKAGDARTAAGDGSGTQYKPAMIDRPMPSDEPLRVRFERKE